MKRYTKRANGRSYIIQSGVGLAGYAALSTVVSLRVLSAEQLSLSAKSAIWAFLWMGLAVMTAVLRRYYCKLPDE